MKTIQHNLKNATTEQKQTRINLLVPLLQLDPERRGKAGSQTLRTATRRVRQLRTLLCPATLYDCI